MGRHAGRAADTRGIRACEKSARARVVSRAASVESNCLGKLRHQPAGGTIYAGRPENRTMDRRVTRDGRDGAW